MLHLVYCSQRKSKLNLVHRNPRTSGPRGFQSNGELRRETPFGTSNSILSKKGHQKISIFCYFDWGMGDLKWGSDHFSGSFFYTYNHCSPSVQMGKFTQMDWLDWFVKWNGIITILIHCLNCNGYPVHSWTGWTDQSKAGLVTNTLLPTIVFIPILMISCWI